jgi:hypothetical protein
MRAPAVELPTDTIDIENTVAPFGEGLVGVALELIASAPSFDRYSAPEIAQALGDSVYATIDHANLPNPIWVTEDAFDPSQPISRQNPPFTAGDLLPSPNSPDGTWEVIDWPTGGPTFENASGMRVQLENDNIAAELSPSNDMDAQPRGSQFTDPDVLPVDSEMREMAVEFIKNDLEDQVSYQKIQRAVDEFNEMATTPGDEFDFGVQSLIEDAYKQAGVPLPEYRAKRFNPDDQRAIGGAAGGERMDVRWPRGIDEQELGVVAGNISDDGYDRELYSPLNQAQLPTDPQTLIRLAEVMEEYAQTRRDVSADYDGQGWYLRVAGVIYQAAADQMYRR